MASLVSYCVVAILVVCSLYLDAVCIFGDTRTLDRLFLAQRNGTNLTSPPHHWHSLAFLLSLLSWGNISALFTATATGAQDRLDRFIAQANAALFCYYLLCFFVFHTIQADIFVQMVLGLGVAAIAGDYFFPSARTVVVHVHSPPGYMTQ